MGRTCVVPNCTSGYSTNPETVSRFTVPKNRLAAWQKAIPGIKRTLTVKDCVCAKHFKLTDIIKEIKTEAYTYRLQHPKLSPNAIPTIFCPHGNYSYRSFKSNSSGASGKKSTKKYPQNFTKRKKPLPKPVEFQIELQLNRQKFVNDQSLTKETYGKLIRSVQKGKIVENERLSVIELDGVKKLIAVNDESTKQLVHDDELYHVLRNVHLEIGHNNGYRMLAKVENTYENITPQEVVLFIRLCPSCHPRRVAYMNFQDESAIYNEMAAKCSVNFIDYRACPDDNYDYVMVYQNQETNFCLLTPLKSCHPAEIAGKLADIFTFIGVSTEIHSNKPKTLWTSIAYELNRLGPHLVFKHVKTMWCPIHIEIQESLSTWRQENQNKWVKRIPMLQLEKNMTICRKTNIKPYEALFVATENFNGKVTNSTEVVRNSTDENFKRLRFETVYSDDYFEEAPMETTSEKDPFEAISNTYVTDEILFVDINALKQTSSMPPSNQIANTDDRSSNYIFGLLPECYQIRDKAPDDVKDQFKKRLLHNRKEHNYYKTLTENQYNKLISRVKQFKTEPNYQVLTVRGVDRLIRPGPKHPKHFVHDDELFDILHYTHINLNHAGREVMWATLDRNFENIVSTDITTYLQLCSVCKPKNYKYDVFTRVLSEHSACSELSARCRLSFIDYQRQPDGDFNYVMIYENVLTKFTMLTPLIVKEPETIAYHLTDIFTFLGISNFIESAEDEDLFKCVIQHLNVVWPDTHIDYHRSEGSVNTCHITQEIKTWMVQNKSTGWAKGLRFVQLKRNRDYHCEIQETPYNTLFGFVDASCENDNDNRNSIVRLLERLYSCKSLVNSSFCLTTSEDAFKHTLIKNRQKFQNSFSLSREVYHRLISQVEVSKQKPFLTQYGVVFLEGSQRLIRPSNTGEVKFYVHDDDLFLILQYIHTYTKHASLCTINRLLNRHFVNILDHDIATFGKLCATCSSKTVTNKKTKASKETPRYSTMSLKCCLDIINLESYEDDGFKYVMIYHNLLTNFCLLKPLKTKSPEEVAYELLDVLTLVGTCVDIETQEECNFLDNVMITILKIFNSDLEIKWMKSKHSLREQIEDEVKNWMIVNDTTKWSRALPLIQLAWNRNLHDGMDQSPYENMFQ